MNTEQGNCSLLFEPHSTQGSQISCAFVCVQQDCFKEVLFFPYWFLSLGKSHDLAVCCGWQWFTSQFFSLVSGSVCVWQLIQVSEDSNAIFSIHHPLILKQQSFPCTKPGMFRTGWSNFSLCMAVPCAQRWHSHWWRLQGSCSLPALYLPACSALSF